MPQTARELSFADPDAAAAAIRSTQIEFCPHGASSLAWKVGSVELGTSSVWWGQVGSPSASIGTMRADLSWFLLAGLDARNWAINRCPLGEGEMAFAPQGSEFATSYPTPGCWYAMAFPRDWLHSHAGIVLPKNIASGTAISTFPLGDARRVRHAFSIAKNFVAVNAELLEDIQVRRSLERALLGAVLHGIGPQTEHCDTRDPRRIAALVDYLRARDDEPVYPEEICRALSTSSRSLRRIFPEVFGTSPATFLRLRRLKLAHRALTCGRFASVTRTAVHYGFFDLGRFSSSYGALFGEMPSVTLHRQASTARA
jgi:AraC-like DNA-binding protein